MGGIKSFVLSIRTVSSMIMICRHSRLKLGCIGPHGLIHETSMLKINITFSYDGKDEKYE